MITGAAFIEMLSARQDYLWFVAALGWITTAALAWRVVPPAEATAMRAWVLLTAATGFVSVTSELVLGVMVPLPGPDEPRMAWDAFLVVVGCVTVTALLWFAAPLTLGHRWAWRVAGVVSLLTLVVVRLWAPWEVRVVYQGMVFERGAATANAAVLLALGQLIWIGASWRQLRKSGFCQSIDRPAYGILSVALVALVLNALLTTSGPLAESLNASRRWPAAQLATSALPAAAIQVICAWAFAAFWWIWLGSSVVQQSRQGGREYRMLVGGAVLWIAFGFILAEWGARGARQRFEANLLAQARTGALLLDRRLIVESIGPEVKLTGNPIVRRQGSGQPTRVFEVSEELGRKFAEIRLRLATLVKTGNARSANLTTLRDGTILSVASPLAPGAASNLVGIQRIAVTADTAGWTNAQADIDGPTRLPSGVTVAGRAPLLDADGRMLGWLNLRVSGTEWAASQAQARLLTFAVVALGLGLGLLAGMQRWHALRHEEARRRATEAAAANQAKTAFLAKVSHELRTPAQSILGYGDMLAASPLERDQHDWLAAMRNQSELMVRLVEDLLDLSALQAGVFRIVRQSTDLLSMLRAGAEGLRPKAQKKGLEFRLGFDASLPASVNCDGSRVRQVLLNLVGNAVKFTVRGFVEINARRITEFPAAADVVWCEVSVKDSGPGISAEERERLFQPFTRLAGSEGIEGAGLGLSVSVAIMRAMGGAITMESDGHSGSTFYMRWPMQVADGTTQSETQVGLQSLHGRRVLVADDNRLICDLLQAYLAGLGAEVTTVGDGDAAQHQAQSGLFDAVVMDVSLPRKDGMAVVSAIRAMGLTAETVRVVGLSAHANPEIRVEALACGMDEFFVKPADLRQIAQAIAGGGWAAAQVSLPKYLEEALRQQFASEYPGQLLELQSAIEARDWAKIEAWAHYVKGSANVLGDAELNGACVRLGLAAQQSDAVAAARLAAILRRFGLPAGGRLPTSSA